MRRLLTVQTLAAAAVILACSAAGAEATVVTPPTYTNVFKGTVIGIDTEGMFGPAGALIQSTYTETYSIYTGAGTLSSQSGPPTSYQDLEGGTQTAYSDGNALHNTGDPITATLTINNKTVTIFSSYEGESFVNDGTTAKPYDGFFENDNTGQVGYFYHQVFDEAESYAGSGFATVLYDTVYSNVSSAAGFPTTIGGQGFNVTVNGTTIQGQGAYELFSNASSFTPLENLRLSPVTAAPEPSTWALMIAGVSMIGAMLRLGRRRGGLATA